MAKAKENFQDVLWKGCDKLRNNMDPAEYKYVVLGVPLGKCGFTTLRNFA